MTPADWTIIEKDKDETGLVLHDVKKGDALIMENIGYSEALEFLYGNVGQRDTIQEIYKTRTVFYCGRDFIKILDKGKEFDNRHN